MNQKIRKVLFLSFIGIMPLFLSSLQSLEILPEVRAAYFRSTDSRFRKIYLDAGLFSLEVTGKAWEHLYPWGSVGILYASGHSIGGENKTRLHLVPIGIGLKYIFKYFRQIEPYLGAGIVIGYTHIHNDSSFVTQKQNSWDVGGIAKAGFLAYVNDSIFFDFFVDYTYLKVTPNHEGGKNLVIKKADLSGVTLGAGIGYRF